MTECNTPYPLKVSARVQAHNEAELQNPSQPRW